MPIEIVVELTQDPVRCVSIPGWSVVAALAVVSAPRVALAWIERET